MENSVTLEMIRDAREALKDVAELTPVVTSTRFGKNLFIKSENLQKTGSFKIRGAYNKIRNLSPEEASHGVIACSAGNHAQGVALSATKLGIRSVICMPEGAPILKVEATRGYGADVVLVPGIYDDAAREAQRLA
ncbi:MAG: pyridoxal-phosphate dependent enzyme, partial [Lachnospiraceae bacterium]|nr:pyridoxal-phosphate dependent enzyme [Lachnospiraceae bacterium]